MFSTKNNIEKFAIFIFFYSQKVNKKMLREKIGQEIFFWKFFLFWGENVLYENARFYKNANSLTLYIVKKRIIATFR